MIVLRQTIPSNEPRRGGSAEPRTNDVSRNKSTRASLRRLLIHREILERPLAKAEEADDPSIDSSNDDHLLTRFQHRERIRLARGNSR